MNGKTIGYWVTTGLVVLSMGMGGAMDLARGPEMVAGMAQLGYPAYFLLILGTWQLLSVPALLAPKLPRLKEWAYAGIAFDLTGAAFSHAAAGDPAGKVITPLVILGIAAASWALRPESRKLAAAEGTPAIWPPSRRGGRGSGMRRPRGQAKEGYSIPSALFTSGMGLPAQSDFTFSLVA